MWRISLWMKLLGNNINGKCFRIIYNLYQNIKSCIVYSGKQTSFFQSYCGVRQGENLSPVLFSLFLNDLDDYLRPSRCSGIKLDSPDYDIAVHLQILVLLYADDTVIFGTDAKAFQENLDAFCEYYEVWKLNVNFNKTKIMIFGIRSIDNFQFHVGQDIISKCNEYKYMCTLVWYSLKHVLFIRQLNITLSMLWKLSIFRTNE